MLTTNKNEIIESMCEDIEKASDSAIAWLADTFDVPLQAEDSKYVGKHSSPRIVSVIGKPVVGSRLWSRKHNEQMVYVRVPVLKNGRYCDGETVVVRGVLVPNDDYHRKAVAVLNIGSHSSRGKKARNKHLPLLNGENAVKRLREGKKVKSVKEQTTRNKKVYNVKFEEDL
jgi:hypothetical protein